MSTFKWGTVTAADPLRVRIDGDAAALPVTPDSLVGSLTVGDRVRCEISDRRLIVHGRQGGMSGSTAQRDAVFGAPGTDAERVALANARVVWFNTELGWEESYYATTGLADLTARGLEVGVPSGWYPTGRGPRAVLYSVGSQAATNGTYFSNWQVFGSAPRDWLGGGSWRNSAHFSLSDPNMLQTSLPGRYRAYIYMTYPNGSGTGVVGFYVRRAAVGPFGERQMAVPLYAGYGQTTEQEYPDTPMQSGGGCYFQTIAAAWSIGDRAHMSLEYLGPLLANV